MVCRQLSSRTILVLLESCLKTCMTYNIVECTVSKFLMMDRRNSRNMQSFMAKQICEISTSSWFYYKEICYGARSHERDRKLGVDVRLILKWALWKHDVWMCVWFVWLSVGHKVFSCFTNGNVTKPSPAFIVDTVSSLWVGKARGRVSIPGKGKIFLSYKNAQTGLERTQPPIKWVPGALCWRIKQPETKTEGLNTHLHIIGKFRLDRTSRLSKRQLNRTTIILPKILPNALT
jgi:hypothetical protein